MTDILNQTLESLNGELLSTLADILRIERLLVYNTVISAEAIETLYWYSYALVSLLVVLKFLWKGFSIYILWRDGDADSSPQGMAIGAIQGTIFIAVFPFLYNIMIDVAEEYANGVLSALGLGIDASLPHNILGGVSLGAFNVILFLVTVPVLSENIYVILPIVETKSEF